MWYYRKLNCSVDVSYWLCKMPEPDLDHVGDGLAANVQQGLDGQVVGGLKQSFYFVTLIKFKEKVCFNFIS